MPAAFIINPPLPRSAMYLASFDEGAAPVHVVLRVHDEHHLVRVQLEAAIQAASTLHAQLAAPFAARAHGLHLPQLPAPEAAQVPGGGGADRTSVQCQPRTRLPLQMHVTATSTRSNLQKLRSTSPDLHLGIRPLTFCLHLPFNHCTSSSPCKPPWI